MHTARKLLGVLFLLAIVVSVALNTNLISCIATKAPLDHIDVNSVRVAEARPETTIRSGERMLVGGSLRHRASLRSLFPFVTLERRLDYEQDRLGLNPALSPGAARELTRLDDYYNKHIESVAITTRRDVLRDLHDSARDEFVQAQGFGYVRTPLLAGREQIALPDPGVISQMAKLNFEPELTERRTPIPLSRLKRIHLTSQREFLDPDEFGYVRSLREVAGFVAHRFSRNPASSRASKDSEEIPRHNWRLRRLNLISLLRFEKPMVYQSSELPRMDRVEDVQIRDLDEFERVALAKLFSKEDLVIGEEARRIRMIGSLRAGRICLDCHAASHGELLGALTYEFVVEIGLDDL